MTLRVLLADDRAIVRNGLHSMLQAQRGIHVVSEATNGRDTVRQAQNAHPDAVIVDTVN